MKIKIIDLFNKIVNNDEVPKKIRCFGEIYEYSEEMKFYYQNGFSMYRDFFTEGNCLNDEVEIIEEEKEIEKIDITKAYLSSNFHENVLEDIATLQTKVNELIDEINKLKKAG